MYIYIYIWKKKIKKLANYVKKIKEDRGDELKYKAVGMRKLVEMNKVVLHLHFVYVFLIVDVSFDNLSITLLFTFIPLN